MDRPACDAIGLALAIMALGARSGWFTIGRGAFSSRPLCDTSCAGRRPQRARAITMGSRMGIYFLLKPSTSIPVKREINTLPALSADQSVFGRLSQVMARA